VGDVPVTTFLYICLFAVPLLLLGIVFCKVCLFLLFSSLQHRHHKQHHARRRRGYPPLVSIIIPAYNEGLTLENCVASLVTQTYHCYEIIIVDDGSTDDTLAIARRLAETHRNIWALSMERNGGKAAALNHGIQRAHGSIVVSIDADSHFLVDTVEQLVLSFEDPTVAAVGGNVRVANRKPTLSKHQALEYITGLTLQRRAFAHLGCMQVISGAVGAFRKDILLKIGGYSKDTIVEDMDVTIELAKRGYKVIYNPHAIAYTEAPESVSDFLKQRYRWTYGGFQVIAKHRDELFRKHRLGIIGLPYFAIFPWVDVIVSFLLLSAIVRAVLLQDPLGLALFYLVMCSLQMGLTLFALIVDKEDKKLVRLVAIDSLFYTHLISYTTVRAGINYLLRKKVTWNKLQRQGKNVLQPSPSASE
jgi:poly-beta-1,6 N-acetyl-D-glucosamine synthase